MTGDNGRALRTAIRDLLDWTDCLRKETLYRKIYKHRTHSAEALEIAEARLEKATVRVEQLLKDEDTPEEVAERQRKEKEHKDVRSIWRLISKHQ